MRYENWDVLLFPEGSKIPVQEFRTQCFAARDLDSPYLHNQSLLDRPPSYYQPTVGQGGPGQIPVLTAFVPSMTRGSAFRVSVHSWQAPRPTKILESLMQPDGSAMYEVKIFIDGYCISGSLIDSTDTWPHIIDLSAQVDKDGNQDSLRFPPFHDEILRHSHWDATEVYGRIRIIISEGLCKTHRSPPFERVRDVAVFSFQHAPLHILEQSNIAWPNSCMWQQGPRPFIKYTVGNEVSNAKDYEAHSHSPTRHEYPIERGHERFQSSSHSMWPYRLYPTLPTRRPQTTWWPELEARWAQTQAAVDPFVEPFKVPSVSNRRNRSTLSDVPMPDYVGSTSSSSRDISGITRSSNERNKEPEAPARIDDEQYNQLIEALSPRKFCSGAYPPANTPTSNEPMTTTKARASGSRAGRQTGSASRPGPLRELSQPESRVPSNASVESRDSEDNTAGHPELLTPSRRPTGKKERRSSRGNSSVSSRSVSGGKQPSKPTESKKAPSSSEVKRKRQLSSADAGATENGSANRVPSPTKKISRFTENEDQQDLFGTLLEATTSVAAVVAATGGSDLEDE